MTNTISGIAEELERLELDLIARVIGAYHTTRLSDVPANIHVRSKVHVREAFERYSATLIRTADDREKVLREALEEVDEDWIAEVISDSLDMDWTPRDAARLIVSRLSNEPTEHGAFKGDVWFGHPVKRTLGTHQWDGQKWQKLPSELEGCLDLLAKARAEIADLRSALAECPARTSMHGCPSARQALGGSNA